MVRIALALISSCCALSALATPPTVYLDDSAAWDAVKREHPQRYAKILEVMKIAQAEPCMTAPAVIRTKLEVNARCEAMVIYTSLPAKTRLRFTLDDTDYAVYVVQEKLSRGGLVPAK